ncbi:MAG: hypothetical protein RI903_771 [Bacteroidota bacterium]|jgi:hypothetical protein
MLPFEEACSQKLIYPVHNIFPQMQFKKKHEI